VKLRIRVKRGTRVRSITIYVGGRKVKTVPGRHKYVSLSLRGRPHGLVYVLVKIKAVRNGRRVTLRSRHTYHLCTPKRQSKNHSRHHGRTSGKTKKRSPTRAR
jgi:hypothetical protein